MPVPELRQESRDPDFTPATAPCPGSVCLAASSSCANPLCGIRDPVPCLRAMSAPAPASHA
eukprot:12314297-Prorocentrum_lima.AAC.1